ncbi:MAG: hypothetical protein HY548_09720 [Elusimicrobia bacterium]|nr:hypothetical protein [Elusimicrobiota bacterium]
MKLWDLITLCAASALAFFAWRAVRANRALREQVRAGRKTEDTLSRTLIEIEESRDRIQSQASQLVAQADELYLREKELQKEIAVRKETQDRLHQAQKMEAMGRLAGGVAHEINNPLGVILGFAESLELRIDPQSPLAMPVRHILREAKRCKTIVQNLLVLSRSSVAEEKEMLDVNDTIEQALVLIMAQTRIYNVELEKKLAGELPHIFGNSNQLQQVVINLCNNAVDAMPSGGRLTVGTGRDSRDGPPRVTFFVTDTGAGIPQDIQSKVFDPFFTTKDVGKGTGLGLTLVHEIVKKHGGEIVCRSELGLGTTFVVSLPVAGKEMLQDGIRV